MIDKICKMKDKLCEYAHQQMQQGLDRVDAREMGAVIDMIKDLAEAEKSCMEADYYESVVEAMEEGGDRYGYDGGGPSGGGSREGSGGRSGYRMESSDGEGGRMGYKNQYGNWPANPANRRRRMRRRGYTEESVENIRSMMEEADPARREQLKRDLEELMREM